LGYYTRLSGSSVPTFRDNLSVKKSKNNSWLFKMGRIGCPETSIQSYRLTLRNIPEERRFHAPLGCKSRTLLPKYGLIEGKSILRTSVSLSHTRLWRWW
jgi:hypothetical protein